MRILIFNWRDIKNSWAGGGEIYVFEQAKRWVKKGHHVSVFCGEDPEKNLPLYETIDGIKIYRKGGRYSLYFWAFIYYFRYFRGHYDVVIDVENGIPFFTPLYCRIPKVCFVYHIHGNQFLYEVPHILAHIGIAIERYAFPILYHWTTIIVISESTKTLLESYGIPDENITIVYCGIQSFKDLSKVPKKFRTPTILYLGRIKRYKRVDLLVKIFPEIIKNVPQVRLIIAGWGTEASNIADLVMKSRFRRNIILMGPVSSTEKNTLLDKSWVFVNPSIGEGWSIAVIEANRHGTPAVAFRVPGLSDSIQNDKTGYLAQTASELIFQINKILLNNKVRKKMSRTALSYSKQFSWDKTADDSLSILFNTIKK